MKKAKKQITETKEERITARIAAVMNRQAKALLGNEILPCYLPGTLRDKNDLAVGDEAELLPIGGGQYKLRAVLPRESALYRGDRRTPGRQILVAANAHCLLVVITADYLLHQAGYPESGILCARRANVRVGLYVSKWDLIGAQAQALLREKLELYRASVDFVFTGDAHEPDAGLYRHLAGAVTAVVGDRAAGKTTLIRALTGQREGPAPVSTHTSILFSGPENMALIDTPGFREFALPQVTEAERAAVFPELAGLAEGCAFRGCSHVHEEGCRILAGLRTKEIRRERYDAYQRLAGAPAAPAKPDYRHTPCQEQFVCKACGKLVVPEGAGSRHRNHCPNCLSSLHVDDRPGDRACLCGGIMEPVSVWVRKGGEWALVHRCRACGAFSSNRIAADDNPALLLSIAVRPLAATPFPLEQLERGLLNEGRLPSSDP